MVITIIMWATIIDNRRQSWWYKCWDAETNQTKNEGRNIRSEWSQKKVKPERFGARKGTENPRDAREKSLRNQPKSNDKKERFEKLSHLFRRQDLFHGTIRILGTCSSRGNTFYENHQGNMFGIIGKLQNLPSFQYSHRTLHPDAVCP